MNHKIKFKPAITLSHIHTSAHTEGRLNGWKKTRSIAAELDGR